MTSSIVRMALILGLMVGLSSAFYTTTTSRTDFKCDYFIYGDLPSPKCPRFSDLFTKIFCCRDMYGNEYCCDTPDITKTAMQMSTIVGIVMGVISVSVVLSLVLCCICPCCLLAKNRNQGRVLWASPVHQTHVIPATASSSRPAYNSQGTYPPSSQGSYPPNGSAYPPNGSAYPPNGSAYPPSSQGAYPPNPGYPPATINAGFTPPPSYTSYSPQGFTANPVDYNPQPTSKNDGLNPYPTPQFTYNQNFKS